MSKRAKIPKDVKIWQKIGTERPIEVDYDAFEPYRVLWVITNGKIERKFLWVSVKKTGIYVASAGPTGFHTSYHADGTFHWKVHENTVPFEKRPPLPDIPDPVLIQNGTTSISDKTLELFEMPEFKKEEVDKIFYLDNRTIPPSISYETWAIPPFEHYKIKFHTDFPAHMHVLTHTNPWLLFIIYEQTKTKTTPNKFLHGTD